MAQRYTLPPLLFTLRIVNPPEENLDKKGQVEELDKEARDNRDLLKEIIKKRISAKHIDKLFENSEQMFNKVVDYSGGNLRQLIAIIYNAAMEAIVSNKLTEDHINKAIKALRQTLSFVIKDQIEIMLLYDIMTKHIPTNEDDKVNEKFEELLHNNLMFFYYNGDIWFAVNPIIEETVIRRYKLLTSND